MDKPVLRVLFSCALSLFLAITGLGIGVCHFTQTILFNPNTLIQVAGDCGYTQQLHSEIAREWENLFAITGVENPEEMMSVLTRDIVNADSLNYIANAYAQTAAVRVQQLADQLTGKVREYAYSQTAQADRDGALEENINDLVNACIGAYKSAVEIPALNTILGTFSKIAGKLDLYACILSILLLAFMALMYFLQRKRTHTLYYMTISAAAGGIVLLGIPAITMQYNILARLPFSDSAVKTLLIAYGANAIDAMVDYGTIYMIIAGILLCGYLIASAIRPHRIAAADKQQQ